jgi:hypothetical protein
MPVQPGEPAVGAHPGLVEVSHRRGRDPVADNGQDLVDDPEGGAFHPTCHRGRGDRHTEQVAQSIGGAADRQELPVQ